MEEKTDQQQAVPADGQEVEALRQKLKLARLENRLTIELADNGANDLETAALVAKSRMKATGNLDVKEIVEKIKEEKPFLFASQVIRPNRTQPVKSSSQDENSNLKQIAKKASKNATRKNVFEYMKARRGWEVEVKR